MEAATRRMAHVLNKLPKEITPVNLEELRRVKQALVELESKADQLRSAGAWSETLAACHKDCLSGSGARLSFPAPQGHGGGDHGRRGRGARP